MLLNRFFWPRCLVCVCALPVVVGLVGACAGRVDIETPAAAAAGDANGFYSEIGNPASAYCLKVGGRSVAMEDLDGGQWAMCAFGSAAIGEWTLLRRQQASIDAFFSEVDRGAAIDVDSFCIQAGGNVRNALRVDADAQGAAEGDGTISQGTKWPVATCRFDDGGTIDSQTLYGGAQDPNNAALVQVLQRAADL